jgi:L-threonylcarbamoyladenylate synthase
MNTVVYNISDLNNIEAKEAINTAIINNDLVVFPTETVYGIGANALSEIAVKKIFKIKGRPSDNPLIVHLSHSSEVHKYVKDLPKHARLLMDYFWPGPLTLIFEHNGILPDVVTGGLKTVAIRVPSHPIANMIISLCNLPICAPSANISGRPSSTLFSHVKDDFYGLVPIIIDGGPTQIGVESTVLDLTVDTPVILRPGKITKSMIEEVLGIKILENSDIPNESTPKSPGMKYKHYAPKGIVTLVDGQFEEVVKFINSRSEFHKDKSVAVLCPDEYVDLLKIETVIKLGSLRKLEVIGENLFKSLRMMDELEIDYIYIPVISSEGFGQAIMNRLLKAANYNIIRV